jgi:hypothetical protein
LLAKLLVGKVVRVASARARADASPCWATAVPDPVATEGGQQVTTASCIVMRPAWYRPGASLPHQ